MLNKSSDNQPNKSKLFLNSFFAVLLAIATLTSPIATNAQTTNDDQKPESKSDTKTDEKIEQKTAKEIAKELEREKKNSRDIKTITDRINKNKDEYVIQIRLKFLTNSDNLTAISNKIEARINKLEISGENVDEMNAKLADANNNIKKAKNLLKTLPAKKNLLDYDEAKKYATAIIEARNNLEDAKETLSEIISNLKDLVIDKTDDKN